MATTTQIKTFISQIAPCAQIAYKNIGKVLPSICIGMACVESGYGTAGSCKHYSYLGQKVGSGKTATKYWDGTFFTSKTGEEYTVGTHTTITAAFRSYKNMQQCVNNYYELLNTSLYRAVKIGSDYSTQMKQIKSVGYMTSSTEVNTVIGLIQKYNLTQYDNGISNVVINNNVNKDIVVSFFNITKGNTEDYYKIVKNIKLALNKDYGLNFAIDNTIDNILITNLGNVILSKTTRKTKINTVYSLQQLLKWWGYALTVDGDFYIGTDKVIKQFQNAIGATQDGKTSKIVWCKLLGYNNK